MNRIALAFVSGLVVCALAVMLVAAKQSPSQPVPDRDVYYPATEAIGPDEVRIVAKQGFAPQEALMVGTQGHTSPEQFGKVMSLVEPRLAVGYHFYNDFDTEPVVRERVRRLYDGPLDLALDYMVWNVTKDDIRVRMSAVVAFSKFTISGALPFPEVVQPLFDEINEMYGTKVEPIFN